jgi:hypothetical protein
MSLSFTESEISTIRNLLTQCYQKDVEIHLADSEVILSPDEQESKQYPTVFWHAREANFVVIKTGMLTYRTQFFYTPHDQYGTGNDEYSDLEMCVAAVLKMQSDHERERQETGSGTSDETLNQEPNS